MILLVPNKVSITTQSLIVDRSWKDNMDRLLYNDGRGNQITTYMLMVPSLTIVGLVGVLT